MNRVIVNLKTTGLDPILNGIWSINYTIINDDGVFCYDEKINCKKSIDDKALAISGINKNDLVKFKKNDLAIANFINRLDHHNNSKDKYTILSFNSIFEFNFLKNWVDTFRKGLFYEMFISSSIDLKSLILYLIDEEIKFLPNTKMYTIFAGLGLESNDNYSTENDGKCLLELYNIIRKKIKI